MPHQISKAVIADNAKRLNLCLDMIKCEPNGYLLYYSWNTIVIGTIT